MGKRGRPKSRETLDKEAFKEWKDTANEAFNKTELTGRRLHHSPRHNPEEAIRLSGNLKNEKELKILFEEFQRKGLIPEYVPNLETGGRYYLKDAESLRFWLGRLAKEQWNKPEKFGPKIPGKDSANQWKIAILNKLVQDTAKEKIGKNNLTPELLEDIENMSWEGLPLKIDDEGNVSYARRQFSDKVPQSVIEWGNKNLGNDTGTRWAKDVRKGWEELRLENLRYKELTGFEFDRGHFYPSARGGPNTRRNASTEVSWDMIGETGSIAGNRTKKDLPNWKGTDVGRELGTSNTWKQDLIEFHLDETGKNANQLPKDYLLDNPQHAKIQQRQTLKGQTHAAQAAIAKNYEKYIKTDQQLMEVVESYKQQGIIPPEAEIKSIDDIKKYSSARRAIGGDFEIVDGQVVKKPKQTVIQQILGVKKKPNRLNGMSDLLSNTPDNYEVDFTPKPTGIDFDQGHLTVNGNNGNGVNGKNGNGIAVNGKNGKNGFLKGMENVKNYSGLGKLRDADQIANIGLNVSTGNVGGAALGAATYGTSKALQNKQVQARIAKQITKLVAERGAKSAAKMIPGLDILLSGKESWDYLKRGRWDQAGVAALSGAIGWIPIVGDGASAALDLSNTGLDIARLQAPTGNNKKKGKNRLQRYLKSFYN